MKPSKRTETVMLDRRDWLKKWIKLREYDVGSKANDFLFCYHCTNRALYSPELSWKLLLDMNEQLVQSLPIEKLIKINQWKLIWLTNESIIQRLAITKQEVRALQIGHNKQEKIARDKRKFDDLILYCEIEKKYEQGMKTAEIANEFAETISKRTVQRTLAKIREEKLSEEEKQERARIVLEAYQETADLNLIARRTKCSVDTVRRILNLQGMTEMTKQEIKRIESEPYKFKCNEGKELFYLSSHKTEKTESQLTDFEIAMATLRTYQKNILIVGSAGTGKSFLINQYLEALPLSERKVTLIVAPTGRAADNLNAQTIHKAFQFPSEVQPNEEVTAAPKHLYNYSRIIIDEINMVRQDVFSRMIKTIRFIEQQTNKQIQVIALGDFSQISPCADAADMALLNEFYPDARGVYAFHSDQWIQIDFRKIVLKHIYRQNDSEFIEKLNEIKYGNIAAIDWFNKNSRVFPSCHGITICPTRKQVDYYNREASYFFDPDDMVVFNGTINGKTEEQLPCPQQLRLAIGMRVMTICNADKYKNGSMGEIVKLNGSSIRVLLDSGELVTVRKRRFTLQDGLIYEQIPIVLAYAITANKSEGMTFEAINIVPGFFAPGMLYTVLSRVKSIRGLYIEGELTPKDLHVDIEALRMTIDEK